MAARVGVARCAPGSRRLPPVAGRRTRLVSERKGELHCTGPGDRCHRGADGRCCSSACSLLLVVGVAIIFLSSTGQISVTRRCVLSGDRPLPLLVRANLRILPPVLLRHGPARSVPSTAPERTCSNRAAMTGQTRRPHSTARPGGGRCFFCQQRFRRWPRRSSAAPVVIGAHTPQPHAHAPFFNISAMSFGAPRRCVRRHGAARAGASGSIPARVGCTYHLEGGLRRGVRRSARASNGVRDAAGRLDEAVARDAARPEVKTDQREARRAPNRARAACCRAREGDRGNRVRIRGIPEGQDSIVPIATPTSAACPNCRLDFIARVRDAWPRRSASRPCSATRADFAELWCRGTAAAWTARRIIRRRFRGRHGCRAGRR